MLLVLSCGPATSKKYSSAGAAKNLESSVPELSSRNQSLLAVYSAEIETAADKVILESPSPAARRFALEWKAEAIPVLQASLLKTDPVAAVLDSWVFLYQMRAFVELGPQKQALGDFHPAITETIRSMDAQMQRIVQIGAPKADIAGLRQKLSSWAEAHPIRVSLVGRESVDPELIKQTEESDMGTRASIQALGESIGDVTARLDSYNTYAPKQARWQAELMLEDLKRDPEVRGALSNFDVLSKSAAKASGSVEQMPEVLARTREGVNADIENQRLSVQTFLRQERLETLAALQQERIATLVALRGERVAATADLRGERQVILQALHGEGEEMMTNLDAISNKSIENLDVKGRSLIDHFFVRALELMLLLLLLCSVAFWIILRSIPPKLASTRVPDQ